MQNRKILVLALFISLLAISAVSASDNVTGDIVSMDNATYDVAVSENGPEDESFDDLSQLIQDTSQTLKLDKNYKNTENSPHITIDKSITIDGQGHTIDANYASRAFYVNSSGVTFKNINFINGKSDYYGGALYFEPDYSAVIINCTFINCSSPFGGAITLLGSDSYISQCRFETNHADYYGGAVFAMYGSIDFDSNIFTDNSADLGGGVYLSQVAAYLTNNQFLSNSASNGGAVWAMTTDLKSDTENVYRNNRGSPQRDFYSTLNDNLTITIGDYYQFVGHYDNFTVLPSYYSMVDYNLLTPVKNQGTEGNCWSFSALAALESCILKASNITFDFSESNLKNLMANYSDYGYKIAVNGGGHAEMAYGYFASWLGPILEVDDVYHTDNILSALLNSIVHVQNIVFLKREDYLDNDAIKNAVLKYGAVSTDMYYNKTYLKDSVSYYFNGDEKSNHAVCIVGWDDGYSRFNFKNTPVGDGAWIVRNSWGPSWGDGGYFYVSYYDSQFAKINTSDSYTFILNDTVKLDRVYQYEIEKTSSIVIDKDAICYKNIFTAQGDEYLAAVSTYFNEGCDYRVSVLLNGELRCTKSGKTDMGYYTVNLDNMIHLNRYDNVTVIFNCTNIRSGEGRIPCSDPDLNTNLFIPEGVSYYWNGNRWVDFISKNAVGCIKMFTTFSLEEKLNPYFEIVCDGNPWDNSYVISVMLPNDATGNVSFDVGGAVYVINLSESKSIVLYNLTESNSTLVVRYSGNDIYLEKTLSYIVDTNLSKTGTFDELSALISSFTGAELNLIRDYYATGAGEGIDISRTMTINGNGRTIDANHISGIFNVNAKNVVLKNINFVASNGSAVEILNSNCSIVNCTFTDNHVYSDSGEGAAIRWNGNNGFIRDSTFISNSAAFGGAICWNKAAGELNNCTFINNSANDGGAVYWYSENAIVDYCTFVNNSATNIGGAFYSNKDNVSISNSVFSNNCYDCEAIYIRANNLAIINSTFTDHSNVNPSVINIRGDNCTVFNSIFKDNRGRAIRIRGNHGNVMKSTFINNTEIYEGAVYGNGSATIVSGCLFVNNSAMYGGAVSLCGSNSKIYNSSFISNSASQYGGAVNLEEYGAYLDNCTFVNNSAPYGGAVFWYNTNGILVNSLFEDNVASGGGAIYWRSDNGYLFNSTFINNLGNNQIYWVGDDGNIVECKFINTTEDNIIASNANIVKRDLTLTTNNPANNSVIFNALSNVPITSPIAFRVYNAQTSRTFEIYVKDNVASIRRELTNFEPGVWHVTAEFEGDDNYNANGITFTTLVDKPYSSLNLTVVNVASGQVSTLTATVLDPYDLPINEGTVTFIDGVTNIGEATVRNGVASLAHTPHTGGDHRITAIFNSENYLSSNDTATLLVDCLNMVVSVDSGKVGVSSTFVVKVRGMYSVINEGNITFYVDDDMVGIVGVVNGTASIDYVPSVAGLHDVWAVLSGTPIDGRGGHDYIVSKGDSTISVAIEDNITYGENATVILTTNVNGKATVRVGAFSTTVNVTNKMAIVSILNLEASDEPYMVHAEFIGGQNYKDSNGSAILKVSKARPAFDINVDDIEFNHPAKIDVRFKEDVTGSANITVSCANGYEVKLPNVTISNGIFTHELASLSVSAYTLTFEYGGNNNYNSTTIYETFNVFKATPTVNVEVTNATFGKTAKITVSIDAEGNVTVDIVSVRTYEDLLIENGQVIQDVDNIGAGTYDVKVTYNGNDNYNNRTSYAKLAIYKASSSVVANASDITYSENLQVNVTASLDGSVVVKIGDDYIETANVMSNAVKSIDFTNIPAGKHNVSVTFTPSDKNYDASSYNTSFTVFKKSTSVILDVEDSVYGREVIVNVTASEDGRITVVAGSVTIQKDVSANTLTPVNLGILAADSYEVTASLDAGSNYEIGRGNGNIVVSPAEARIIDVQTSDNVYGTDSIINVQTDVGGTLIVQTSKGEKRFVIFADTLTPVNLGILDAVFQNIEITLDAGSNYTKPTANANLTITPKATTASVTVKDSVYGDNIIVNVSASESGKIAVQLGEDVKYVDVLANRIYSVDMGIADAGSYTVNITFDGGSNFNKSYDSASVTVSPKQSTVRLHVDEYDAAKSVIVNVTADADGRITLKCGDISKIRDVSANEIASFDLGIFAVGTYDVNVTLTTGNNYIGSTDSSEFKVLSKISDDDISISVPEIKAGQENTIPIALPSDATGTVTLKIAGESYDFDVNNGTAIIKVPKLSGGTYDYSISYSGDDKYLSFTKKYSMTVKKIVQTSISASDVSTVYNGGKFLVATLKDENGKALSGVSLSVNLNGVKYLKTDKNGQVKLTTNGLAPKTYTVTITFAGNADYTKSSKTVKVTVKKATPKLTAGKKTFKVKVKTKKYTVTIKDNQNKAMKSVKLTIKVKGKTYSAKTNAQGKATFKIKNLKKKGKYSATVTFKGNSNYNKVAKKVKITVK